MNLNGFLGRRYDLECYNCWDLARDVWLHLTGDDIGNRTPDIPTSSNISKAISVQRSDFEQIDMPASPCLVLMRGKGKPPHIGVFYQGNVMHIKEAGVQYEPLCNLKYENMSFYK